MMSSLVVGLGAMGLRHAEALAKLGVSVVGGVDLDPEARHRAGESKWFSGTQMFSSLEEALNQQRPEILTVASTAPAHAEAIKLGIQAGLKLILAEKPLTTSLATAERLRLLSVKHGAYVAVNHQSRFLTRYDYIRNVIGTQEFGALRSITVSGSDFGLAMNGIHFVEIFEWLCKERITEVFGDLRPSRHRNPRGAQFQDYEGVLMAWTQSGRRLQIDCSQDMGHGICMAFGFERGKIVWDELTGQGSRWHRSQENLVLPSYRYGTPSELQALNFPIEDLVEGTCRVLSAMLSHSNYPTIQDGESAMVTLISGVLSTELGGRKIGIRKVQKDRVFHWA